MALTLRFVITDKKLRRSIADDGIGGFTTTDVFDVYATPEFHEGDSGHPNYDPWGGGVPSGNLLLAGVVQAAADEYEIGSVITLVTDDTV